MDDMDIPTQPYPADEPPEALTAATRRLSAADDGDVADDGDDTLLSASGAETIAARPAGAPGRTDTRPLAPPVAFARRPAGAIFGDTFLYENLVFDDDHQTRYSVRQLPTSDEFQIRVCPNPECGAVFPPRNGVPEKFCTDCGNTLEKGSKDLVLIEAQAPIPEAIVRTAAKGLSHGAVRAPLATFVERLGPTARHCVVVNRIGPLENPPEPLQAVRWTIRLARGLDYLHDNGVGFDGKLDSACLGMAGGLPVWVNFTTSRHQPDGYVAERLPDTRRLALLAFGWLTGKNSFEPSPNLAPAIQHVFREVFEQDTIAGGLDLAEALEQAIEEMVAPQAVDFEVGRCSHVGMVRTLNEDSLLCLEMDRILQSVSQPLGVFVVADGMGGHTAGEIASSVIVNTIAQKALKELLPNQITQPNGVDGQGWLRQAVEAANAEVHNLRTSAGTDMGSTLVAAVVDGNHVHVAHIGDSRAYRINQDVIQRLTVDHSLVERLVATNQITPEEARYHPQRNVIYRTVGDKAAVDVESSTHLFALDDCLLLCSDGLIGPVEDATIARLVREAPSAQAACDALIRAANAGGGDDNITVLIIKMIAPSS